MKRERSSERKSKSSSKRHTKEVSSDQQWYDVLLDLHIKSTQQSKFVSFRHAWKEHMSDYYRLTNAINRSEDRRELPTIPQPTHTIEWLARTGFRHRPVRNKISQQKKQKAAKKHKQHVQHSTSSSNLIY